MYVYYGIAYYVHAVARKGRNVEPFLLCRLSIKISSECKSASTDTRKFVIRTYAKKLVYMYICIRIYTYVAYFQNQLSQGWIQRGELNSVVYL